MEEEQSQLLKDIPSLASLRAKSGAALAETKIKVCLQCMSWDGTGIVAMSTRCLLNPAVLVFFARNGMDVISYF